VTAQITGAIVAPGLITTERTHHIVQHPEGGVVKSIAVKEGDRVHAGQLLLQLDPALLQAEIAMMQARLIETTARRARLVAGRDGHNQVSFAPELLTQAAQSPDLADILAGQERLFDAERLHFDSQIGQLEGRRSQLHTQIDALGAQQEAVSAQRKLLLQELEVQRDLQARGLSQTSRLLALQREDARLGGRMSELTALRADALGGQTDIALEILRLTRARREETIARLRDMHAEQTELQVRMRALHERLARMDIVAPVSGIVFGLAGVSDRAVIRPAEPLLSLVPQDSAFVVASRVSPNDIDAVRLGQPVQHRFSTLDLPQTAAMDGKVIAISADAFTDESTGRKYYRIETRLDAAALSGFEGKPLLSDMPVETFIAQSARSPLSYLLKPMTDYFYRAMRSD
jgi:HlyD family secretion protein